MLVELPFEFSGRVYRSPMPFSRFDKTDVWTSFLEAEIGLVLVLVEEQEYLVYAGRDLPGFYRSQGLDVMHIPVPDFGIPADVDRWRAGLEAAASAARKGGNVAVHCLAGIGRTGTFLACLAKEHLGLGGQDAINWVRETLPGAMENWRQEEFVENYHTDQPGEGSS